MESKTWESVAPNVPSYEEATKYPMLPGMMHPYPNDMLQQHQPQQVIHPTIVSQPPAIQPMIQNVIVAGGGLSAICGSCQMPLHTRVGHVSTCSTHCGFLLCCLFLCWPCAPFVYCSNMCREPRLFCVNCGKRI